MTEHELEQRLRAWYRDGVDEIAAGGPPSELQASVQAIPDRLPLDQSSAGRSRFILLAAAAMLLVLLVGGAIAVASGLLPWPQTDRDTLPQSDLPPAWTDQLRTDLPAGTYYLDRPVSGGAQTAAIRVTFTLPVGWERVQVDHLLWGQTKWLHFAVPDNVYVDGCESLRLMDPPVGPTAADLAAALPAARGWTVGEVSDVMLDGYSGKRVELIGPAADASCEQHCLLRVRGYYGCIPTMRDNEIGALWALDVEDQRIVIWGASEPETAGAAMTELEDVVSSIQIEFLASLPAGQVRGAAP
jgi:hypothetical protein